MNDLSAIQNANNGDSLNQTNIELINKLQSKDSFKVGQGEDDESETELNKVSEIKILEVDTP